ncbi:MAG: phenylalanyl-tRNA synthetase beta chain [Gammaproteobacteria bacterium]|nr:MAG: phenylalanyl-tRNA synthetase beta chain [Gammaproteobacteria bacterium]TND06986.1 MAG: phenylalanyl-tRNA synthetase beta chain [Gammaproteobacteria bacterium]
MKFSVAWLREWVDPGITIEQLVAQLTMAGLEVDSVEPAAASSDGVVVGRVVSVDRHPDADKLTVCRVDVGAPEPLQIVCGAANVRAGILVPAALTGARLPNGMAIKKAKLRGVESSGMLCSAVELGLADSSDGLLELPDDAVPGVSLTGYLRLDDHCIEVDLTPNRADCLSVAGIAREVGVLNKLAVASPEMAPVVATIKDSVVVDIDAPQACPRYVGRVIKGINAQAGTPMWLRERLRRSGVRSISAVVDVTNYVLLELGQPMHAFDLDRLDGGIRIRYARASETLTLLDGQTITLDDNALVIADRQQAQALAGIMGGQASAVSDNTANIFLESAFFSPDVIAGRARKHGLHTDSSHRFERGVDPGLARTAIERATALLLDIVGGQAGPVIEVVIDSELPARRAVTLRASRLEQLLGMSIPADEVTDILRRLGMDVREEGAQWKVTPPGFRFDIAIEADLIEEVARIYGYNELPKTPLTGKLTLVPRPEEARRPAAIRQILVDRGYFEAITYSFVNAQLQASFTAGARTIALANPISDDMSEMRASLWPGLLQALIYNQNRQQSRMRFFEIGLKYSLQDNEVKEEKYVSGVVAGSRYPEQWGMDRNANPDVDFYDAKGDMEALLALSGRPGDFRFETAEHPALQPGRAARVVSAIDGAVGWIGDVHPAIARKLGLVGRVVLFEIAAAALRCESAARFAELSKFPAIRRDLAFIVDGRTEAGALRDTIANVAGDALVDLQLFDVFHMKGLDSGKKSLAFGLTVQEFSRTLTDREVDSLMEQVVAAVSGKHNAKLRD